MDFHCIFLAEKGDHYYVKTRHKDLFSHYNLILVIVVTKSAPDLLKPE